MDLNAWIHPEVSVPAESLPQTSPPPAIQIGAVFPQTELANNREDVAAWGRGVTELGYRHVLAYDHVLSGSQAAHHPKLVGRYDETDTFHEVLVLFGYLAAIAPELEMVTGVLVLPQRQTALVAKQAATLDMLTNGNLRLGVGIGWNDIEYQGLGESFGNRGKRIEEQVEVLRALWTEPIISFEGNWHTIEHAGLAPMPLRRQMPVWIGANADVGIRRAARIADGFFPNEGTIERYEHILTVLRDELARGDRDPANFGIEARISVRNSTADDWKRLYSWWWERGASHISVNTMGAGFTTTAEHLDGLAQAIRAFESA